MLDNCDFEGEIEDYTVEEKIYVDKELKAPLSIDTVKESKEPETDNGYTVEIEDRKTKKTKKIRISSLENINVNFLSGYRYDENGRYRIIRKDGNIVRHYI